MQKTIGFGFTLLLALLLSLAAPVLAHKVEISGEVGGTIHIEPNDTPRAGEPSLTWFALIRRGGEPIPLSDCNCQLSVYAQPYTSGNSPLLQPSLQPVSQEGYENIPGAEITFPQVGGYVLVLRGEPQNAASFQPFELSYDITVATGQSAAPSPIASPSGASPQSEARPAATQPEGAQNETAPTPSGTLAWAIGAVLLGGVALLMGWKLKRRKQ